MDDFGGKVAVITGAASGIGLGLARTAAREGMRVVMADIEAPALEAGVAGGRPRSARRRSRSRPTSATLASVEALAAAAFDTFGGAHLVCLNAGVFQAGVSWKRTEADWEWVLGVNLWGPIHGVRAFVPRLIEQGEPAHVVITSSMAGMLTVAYSGPYVVSKFAAAALAECVAHDLRAEGAAHVGVSCLVPGSVDTRIGWSERNRADEPPSEATAAGSRLRRRGAARDDVDPGSPARRGCGDGVRRRARRRLLDPDDGELRGPPAADGTTRSCAARSPARRSSTDGTGTRRARSRVPGRPRRPARSPGAHAACRARSTASAGSRGRSAPTSSSSSTTGASATTGGRARHASRRTTSTRSRSTGNASTRSSRARRTRTRCRCCSCTVGPARSSSSSTCSAR